MKRRINQRYKDLGNEIVRGNCHIYCCSKVESFEGCEALPEIGKQYKFFDDGKIGYSRRYMATVTNVQPVRKIPWKLRRAWKQQINACPWLYHPKTDYFITCSIPLYDKDPVIFVRRRDGGWFSIDYPHWWMSGRLDVDGSYWRENGYGEWECQSE